jgi:hypothetical protein
MAEDVSRVCKNPGIMARIVNDPACLAQQFGELAITVAAILSGELDDVGCQPFLIIAASRDFALRRAMPPQRRTGATLGHLKLPSDTQLRTEGEAQHKAGSHKASVETLHKALAILGLK